jgi:hypothetical protein
MAARQGNLIISNSIKRGELAIKTSRPIDAQGNFTKRPSSGGTFSIANSPLFMLLPYNIMIAGIPLVLAGPLKTN